jgi:trans-2,3-dihydro-3-hydroxyanthranilate isomerase
VHEYVVLDVFTDTPLEGNQVAVFTDGLSVPDRLMQRTARELNLSETVFMFPAEDGFDARIRIFTPAAELPFAGHPTLGSAFVVGERDGASLVRLQTGVGIVPVSLTREGDSIVYGEMDQAIPTMVPFAAVAQVLSGLGLERSELPVEAYNNGPEFVYVTLPDPGAVAALRPDLRTLSDIGAVGVCCVAGSGSEFKVRMFGPALGVAEDPATGSAAGPLAVHLARHGVIEFGQQIVIRQGAEINRPSVLYAKVEGSASRVQRVAVGGSAVPVARGEYRLA